MEKLFAPPSRGTNGNGAALRKSIKLLLKLSSRHAWLLVLGGLLILAGAVMILPTPLLTRTVIDRILPGKNMDALFRMVVLIFGILLTQKAMEYFQASIFIRANHQIMLDLRVELLRKVLFAKREDERESGYLVARINEDTNKLNVLFFDSFVFLLRDLITFVVGMVAMFSLNMKLALLVCLIIPVFIATSIKFLKITERMSGPTFDSEARCYAALFQNVALRSMFRMFLRQSYAMDAYRVRGEAFNGHSIRLANIQRLSTCLNGFIYGGCPVLILAYGGYQVMKGGMTLGSFIAFSNFSAYLFSPLMRVVNLNTELARTKVALERIQELLDIEEEAPSSIAAGEVVSISLKNVTALYPRGGGIRNATLALNRGDRLGIIGPSGAGKTTLVKVIAGLLEFQGFYSINGAQMDSDHLTEFRNRFGFVEQDAKLFQGTIRENITLGDPRFNDEDVKRALELSSILELVSGLPNGVESVVGESGLGLSAGQKQRIAIARAIIRRPDVLILDEGTASLDRETEAAIENALGAVMGDCILIVVAHNLKTVERCDQIVVIEDGEIVELGTPRDMVSKGGYLSRVL